ncbi:hypothetical protein CLIB1423_07S03334 [[Candida] railenensis]|uniref:Uncharacterized protein n=1 Tax=[Candida] railenensis TaxID=45579 RepID=A0A9P0QPN1_9ASCO|nr:hypothetical protein CLIB1423_07S03334 [[Candida] railenensis]
MKFWPACILLFFSSLIKPTLCCYTQHTAVVLKCITRAVFSEVLFLGTSSGPAINAKYSQVVTQALRLDQINDGELLFLSSSVSDRCVYLLWGSLGNYFSLFFLSVSYGATAISYAVILAEFIICVLSKRSNKKSLTVG